MVVMRRLSILEVAGGHQHMSNEEDSLWFVFNGEIYDVSPLRQDLEQRGQRFQTSHSDKTRAEYRTVE